MTSQQASDILNTAGKLPKEKQKGYLEEVKKTVGVTSDVYLTILDQSLNQMQAGYDNWNNLFGWSGKWEHSNPGLLSGVQLETLRSTLQSILAKQNKIGILLSPLKSEFESHLKWIEEKKISAVVKRWKGTKPNKTECAAFCEQVYNAGWLNQTGTWQDTCKAFAKTRYGVNLGSMLDYGEKKVTARSGHGERFSIHFKGT